MMALAALGAATADAALYDEAVAVGSLAAEEQKAGKSCARVATVARLSRANARSPGGAAPSRGRSLAQIADCYRIAMEQPLFGDRHPLRSIWSGLSVDRRSERI